MDEYTVKVFKSGYVKWILNGTLHREDGPAVVNSEGDKAWYLNGKRHREDGPAIEYSNGCCSWYLDGFCYTKEDYQKVLNPVKELTVQEISELLGYEVKVVK